MKTMLFGKSGKGEVMEQAYWRYPIAAAIRKTIIDLSIAN